MKTQLLTGMAVIALLGASALAQKPETQTANRLTADKTFLTKAAEGGMAEVELGKLAQQRAASDAVKKFAKRMVDDHSKANEELKTIAVNKGVTLPAGLNAKDQATMDRLSKLNGPEFDRAYMDDMVRDHRTDVAEFRREADHGSDPDVKAFAAKTLPTLEDHLKMAEETQRQLK
jgi:putative membrane protein